MLHRYVKTPRIVQVEATECGAVSLAIILSFYGRRVPLEQLRAETQVTPEGCSASDIARTAKRYGLLCVGTNCSADKLRELRIPCIIRWGKNHFAVLEGFKGTHAVINDPAEGRVRVSSKKLRSNFSGVALVFTPASELDEVAETPIVDRQ